MIKIFSSAAWLFLFILMTACVQMPTEKQSVIDSRPQISFAATRGQYNARVLIDNAELGRVGDFIEGVAALRIIPGTHVVKVILHDAVLLEERFYVADGVSRTFVLPR